MRTSWDEIQRQMNAYESLKLPDAPPLNPDIDPFDVVLSGCKKLEQDSELQELLHDIYSGRE